ncbi:type II secretion system F family protein [Aurantiacibacter gilvus]|uniref:Type II secretion system F family protein n=1 Tax=Aurantiacibacter gilvus TaxID=3139141 RepID=A0ABU9IF28_9SPHN
MIEFLDSAIGRFLFLLVIFASVFLMSQVVLRVGVQNRAHSAAINKRLKMFAQGADRERVHAVILKNDPNRGPESAGIWGSLIRNLRRNLMMAALPIGPLQVLLYMAIAFITMTLVVLVLAFLSDFVLTVGVVQVIVAFSAAASIGIPLLVISFLANRRHRKMEQQFPVALDIFVRALRSGHPVASAIELLTTEMEDPLGSEFGLVADEVSYGAELTEALDALAERWDLDDIRMFVVSLSLQNETGGNLAEVLENLAVVIRERQTLYLKVRALSSEGRMTGWLLTALPIIMFVMLFMLNPPFYLEVATDPIFYISFPVLIAWYFVGVFAIRKMIDLEV